MNQDQTIIFVICYSVAVILIYKLLFHLSVNLLHDFQFS